VNLADAAALGLPAAMGIRLASVAAAFACARLPGFSRGLALAGSILASVITTVVAARVLVSGAPLSGVLVRHAPSGIVLGYTVVPLSAWFLLVLGIVAVPTTIYSVGYFAHAITPVRTATVGGMLNVLLGSLETVFAADNAIGFLFAWELMSLATAVLVATEHDVRASRRAAYLYLVMSHVGTGCLIAGFMILAAAAGSLSFPMLLSGAVLSGRIRDAACLLFFLGFGVKAGVIPLHVWLPEAHPAAPSSISALMSAVLITGGVYGLVRVCALGLGTPSGSWGLAFMLVGTISAILGVLYALTQTDIKRMLAYSTIENVGIITLALGAGMTALAHGQRDLAALAIAASLAHVLNHAVFKGLLFLGAGGVVMATGHRHLEQFGGLLRRMPWTGLFFLLGAMAISGLPLLNGFISEWLTFQALLLGFATTAGLVRLSYPFAAAMLALTTALAAACFVRAFGISFLARPRSAASEEAHESPAVMLLPQAFLAVACVTFGAFPGLVLRPLERVVASIPVLAPQQAISLSVMQMTAGIHGFERFDHAAPGWLGLVIGTAAAVALWTGRPWERTRREPTWGCGGELTARTEYTATAFSKPLVMIFRAVYRPTREVEALAEVSPYFPREVRYRAAIEPTFERYVYGPLASAVIRIASGMKVLQAGSLHTYLAYVLVLAVLLLMWLGGTA
jgi:hydrogenase-4 component B